MTLRTCERVRCHDYMSHVTNTQQVVPPPEERDAMNAGTAITTSTKVWTSNSLEPEPLELMVSFCGKLPPNLRNRNMVRRHSGSLQNSKVTYISQPLQITVSLPPEYTPYTRPVLRAVPTGYLEHTSDGISFTSDGTDEYMVCSYFLHMYSNEFNAL